MPTRSTLRPNPSRRSLAQKAGLRYEDKALDQLQRVSDRRLERQYPLGGGFADAVVYGEPPAVVEVKSTFQPEALTQIDRYWSALTNREAWARVIICRIYSPRHLPYGVRIDRMENWAQLQPGEIVIMPWSGRF